MKRAPLLLISALLIPLTALPSLAQSSSAFGLQITPRGAQKLNLATGTTDLPGGGTVRDNKAGLTVVAGFISIKAGESLSASGAVVTTRQGGTLKAQQISYNQKASLVTATGNLSYSDYRVKNLSAQTIYVDTRTGAVTAVGNVSASTPAASAAQMVALPTKSAILLRGAAKVSTLGKDISGETISLNLVTGVADTEVTSSEQAEFAPYLR
ncbi:hypothetical protein EHF33_07130 [Deinococcus psychrotolerans]|uniref:OstA family protein n=2 Tax=Deinococcus TaxID=1298 RepID=A0A553UU56_9DEIO|nr:MULTISPECIES: hypothetical protein [Deinococcus]AZI42544.1 hypothetical protein EHF33_07130 [Deinococcus psychrotolerans]TSA83740.1 hypothetical protein FNU79_12120 [Deinococcus detaillensis]